VIVHGLPPLNPYWEIISRKDKGCESGIGEGTGFSLCRCKMEFFVMFVQFLGGAILGGMDVKKHTVNTVLFEKT